MQPRGGQQINHGCAKRQKREKGERKADKAKGRQKDRKLCREGREDQKDG